MSRKVITKPWPQREDRERNNGGSRWHQDSEEEASDASEEFRFGHAGDDVGHVCLGYGTLRRDFVTVSFGILYILLFLIYFVLSLGKR